MGVKMLTRSCGDVAEPPDRWLATAQSVDMGSTLEIVITVHALKQAINNPQLWNAAMNLGPQALTYKYTETVIERSQFSAAFRRANQVPQRTQNALGR